MGHDRLQSIVILARVTDWFGDEGEVLSPHTAKTMGSRELFAGASEKNALAPSSLEGLMV